MVAKPSLVATRPPRARDQERKKGSFTSSLRMESHSHSGKSRKSTKFRSISRSLILCNAKTSDDGSSPDERYPDPFEISLGQGKEGLFLSSVQLADTSEAGPGSVPDLTLSSEAAQLQAAGSDGGQNCRRVFFMKVRPGFVGLEEPAAAFRCCECKSSRLFIPKSGRHRVLILNKSREEVEAGPSGMLTRSMAVNQAQLTFLLETFFEILCQAQVN